MLGARGIAGIPGCRGALRDTRARCPQLEEIGRTGVLKKLQPPPRVQGRVIIGFEV